MLGDRSNPSAIQLVSLGTRNLKALALPCRLKCGFKIGHHETGGCDMLEVVQGKGAAAMRKTTNTTPAASGDDEDQDLMWGDMLAGFFGVGPFATPSASPPARADKPALQLRRIQPASGREQPHSRRSRQGVDLARLCSGASAIMATAL